MKKNSGITLMSLIVTIIILLILAGVSIRSLTGSKGLINQAKETKTAAEMKDIEEQIELVLVKAELKSNNVTMESVIKQLINAGLIDDESQVNQDTGDITFDDYVLEEKLADYVITPEEKYYGNKNTVVTNPTYFTFTVDEAAGTATITGVKDEYAVKAYQNGEATQYTVAIKDGENYVTDVVIPYEITHTDGNKYKVTAIGTSAFQGLTGTDVTNVDERFTSFVLPNTITAIGTGAFMNCISLSSINIPDGVTVIWNDAFHGCSSLISVNIPDSVTTLKYAAFIHCKSLKSVKMSENLTTLEVNVFANCSSLTSIKIPESVTSIYGYAFNGCTSLNNIEIPNSVTNIGNYAFNMCTSLSSVKIPSNVTTLGIGAFSNCRKLSSIEIPSNVTSIGSQAFSGCTSLSDINVSAENTAYSSENGMLYDKNKTALIKCPEGKVGEVVIPSSVTAIEERGFYYCTGLTKVTIPDSVTSIGKEAFAECWKLISINIPDNVTSIGKNAFWRCTNLSNINIPKSVTTIGTLAFGRWAATQTINCEILEADKPDTWDAQWDYYNATTVRKAALNWGVSM